MKKRWFHIHPKVTLALSCVLLALALGYLWTALDFWMPTQGLAAYKAAAENGLPLSEPVAKGAITFQSPSTVRDRDSHWRVTRRGDDFHVYKLWRSWLLWQASPALMYGPADQPLKVFSLASGPIYAVSDGSPHAEGFEEILLATANHPAVARVEVTFGICGERNTPPDFDYGGWLAEHGVTAECAPSGNGVWVGSVIYSYGENQSGGVLLAGAKAYDSNGTLLCEVGP